jgi:hypothetical protein
MEMKVTKQKIEAAVRKVLVNGVWPIYETEGDHGLAEAEYVNFVTQVLNTISATEKELA